MTKYRERREQGLFEPDESEVPSLVSGGQPSATAELDAMTKPELLAYAQQLGVSPANNAMSKDELRAGVDAKLAGG